MNIRLAYDFDLKNFRELFPETKLYDENDKEPIDLLIFSGGADVMLEYYLGKGDIEEFKNLCSTDSDRDEYELEILRKYMRGDIKVNKILGICRGIQLLNLFMGGTLYPDLATYKLQHDSVHQLVHTVKSNLDFFKIVNSTHHQGCRNTSQMAREFSIKGYPLTIAMDKNGFVREIITWLEDKMLGLQFHPEYYSEQNQDKILFRNFIYSWIKEEITILK